MATTFWGCGKLTGNAPESWWTTDKFTVLTSKGSCFRYCSFDNQADIPSAWK